MTIYVVKRHEGAWKWLQSAYDLPPDIEPVENLDDLPVPPRAGDVVIGNLPIRHVARLTLEGVEFFAIDFPDGNEAARSGRRDRSLTAEEMKALGARLVRYGAAAAGRPIPPYRRRSPVSGPSMRAFTAVIDDMRQLCGRLVQAIRLDRWAPGRAELRRAAPWIAYVLLLIGAGGVASNALTDLVREHLTGLLSRSDSSACSASLIWAWISVVVGFLLVASAIVKLHRLSGRWLDLDIHSWTPKDRDFTRHTDLIVGLSPLEGRLKADNVDPQAQEREWRALVDVLNVLAPSVAKSGKGWIILNALFGGRFDREDENKSINAAIAAMPLLPREIGASRDALRDAYSAIRGSRWNWIQWIRAMLVNIGEPGKEPTLERVVFVTSRESERHKKVVEAIVAAIGAFTGRTIFCDFADAGTSEDMRKLTEVLKKTLDTLMPRRPSGTAPQVAIDVTGGTKMLSIVAALLTVAGSLRILYVNNDGEPSTHDVRATFPELIAGR